MDIVERFLNYVKYDTQSQDETDSVPSTAKQLVFAEYLRKELVDIGLDDVEMDEKGYIYATLKSNIREEVPTIGFISHYDTSPDSSGHDVKPQIVSHYDGSDILLSDGIVSSPRKFPELLSHIGEDLIVTDGTTLLGADDKAGIAEIVQAMVYLQEHRDIKHGKVRVAFNPDEEIGRGAHYFDVEKFGCEWAYTIDGGDLGELEFENFNAAQAKVRLHGVSVHPGYAKDKMVNASRLAAEFVAMIPADETPEATDGYQGFYHLLSIRSSVEEAHLIFIIRDHDRNMFQRRKNIITAIVERMKVKYGDKVCRAIIEDQYYNMLEKISQHPHIVERAVKAMRAAGVEPKIQPIRGGTDGAQLSFKGLPCPNIFTGAVNFHGPHEFVSIQVMRKAMETIVNIAKIN
mgnify:CR=1 FL=1